MIPLKTYLINTIHQWATDNDLTPYLLLDAMNPLVKAPERYVNEGRILLNIAVSVVHQLEITQQGVSFKARFNGVSHAIFAPLSAVMAIYAKENGQGLFFNDEDELAMDGKPADEKQLSPTPSKPVLRLVRNNATASEDKS